MVSVIQKYEVLVDFLFKEMVVNALFDISLNLYLQCLGFYFLVYYNMSLTRFNLFGIVIAFVIWETQQGQVVVQMYFISNPKV